MRQTAAMLALNICCGAAMLRLSFVCGMQASVLVPRTQLGQCKAAVCFWTLLVGLLLPAVILVQPSPAEGQPAMEPTSWLRWGG